MPRDRLKEMREGRERAVDTLEYYDYEIKRNLDLAFDLAQNRRKKVTSVDKANVLEASRLWRQTANQVGQERPEITLEHQLVDSAAMKLITAPFSFDVMVTENTFGDILTDEASVLAGSMGMLPSASLSATGSGLASNRRMGLYEPIHGSAPDIAGQGIANPVGTILSAAIVHEVFPVWGAVDHAGVAQSVREGFLPEAALADGPEQPVNLVEGEHRRGGVVDGR